METNGKDGFDLERPKTIAESVSAMVATDLDDRVFCYRLGNSRISYVHGIALEGRTSTSGPILWVRFFLVPFYLCCDFYVTSENGKTYII